MDAVDVQHCVRGVFGGGGNLLHNQYMNYLTIATEGDAVDFGDLTVDARFGASGCSNGHGGLG